MCPSVRPALRTLTSDGHAQTHLRSALQTHSSALLIRAAVAELPGPVGLEDALEICLALLELEPHTYALNAARWGSRLAIEKKLTLTDAQLPLAALATLPGPGARAGAEALIELSSRYGLRRVDELVFAWLDRRGMHE